MPVIHQMNLHEPFTHADLKTTLDAIVEICLIQHSVILSQLSVSDDPEVRTRVYSKQCLWGKRDKFLNTQCPGHIKTCEPVMLNFNREDKDWSQMRVVIIKSVAYDV